MESSVRTLNPSVDNQSVVCQPLEVAVREPFEKAHFLADWLRLAAFGWRTEEDSSGKKRAADGTVGTRQKRRGIKRNFSTAIFALKRSRGDCISKRIVASSKL